ncbi:NAD(P)-dependent oxidoreductase [Candidatus Gottesmanbacteria bacterium]|nr:NAD(P)-dependent oxidoreductase [Candidatus Gottesmanbacteria bacterium]
MKILITGGCGFLGVTLARYLLSKNEQVILFDKVPLDIPELSKKVKVIIGDVRNKKAVEKALSGVDYVIHAAAALPIQQSGELIHSVNVIGTKNVLQAAFNKKVKRVVFISTTAVYKIDQKHPITEEGLIEPIGYYGSSKIEAEKVCHEYQNKGLVVQIIRPKTFVGPSRLGVFEILFEWIYEGRKVPILGNGKNYYQLLDVRELCNAIYLSLTTKYTNETFNIGAKKFGTVASDLNYVIKKSGSKSSLLFVPALPVQIILSILEKLQLSPLAAWHYKTANIDSYVDITKAQKMLGWSSKVSGAEVLYEAYEWFVKHKSEFEGKTGVTHRVGWNQKILGLVRRFM